jgi:predicted metal-binding protein
MLRIESRDRMGLAIRNSLLDSRGLPSYGDRLQRTIPPFISDNEVDRLLKRYRLRYQRRRELLMSREKEQSIDYLKKQLVLMLFLISFSQLISQL